MSTQSVVTAIAVLETVSKLQPVGLSEIARETGASKATVLRMLTTLRSLDWVSQAANVDASWSLTFHAYAVAARSGVGASLRDMAIGPMSGLQLDTTETVHLCVPDGRSLVLVERLDTPHVLRAFLALGSIIPLHASATGLAFLAASSDAYIEDMLGTPLDPVTPSTKIAGEAVWREVGEARRRGYSINEEGLSLGITSLGAAIVESAGHPVGCVSVSGPSFRITPDKYEEYGEAVMRAAQEISSLVSGRS